jgi:3-isopropylmalate/(R)-2-methylmalate dehydratase small subunit
MRRISHITGRALPMRGNDIDTDRIIPARFLRSVTFDGMEQHVFEDDRKSAGGPYNRHPFDVKHFQGAAVLLVNATSAAGRRASTRRRRCSGGGSRSSSASRSPRSSSATPA